jgi:hypothetical protein
MFGVGCSMFDVFLLAAAFRAAPKPRRRLENLAFAHCAGTAQNSPPPHQPREAKGLLRGYGASRVRRSLLRGWQNGKSGFNASRSRFGLPPLAFAVSAQSFSI